MGVGGVLVLTADVLRANVLMDRIDCHMLNVIARASSRVVSILWSSWFRVS